MIVFRASLLASAALLFSACAASPAEPDYSGMTDRQRELAQALDALAGIYPVSDNAKLTRVKDERGNPVGLEAYEDPADALEAGDVAAFIAGVKAGQYNPNAADAFPALIIAIDEGAAGNFDAALSALEPAKQDETTADFAGFIEAWTLALQGDGDAAIAAHRRITARLPGMTGDLSLAALLEALGREDEALAVYDALIPTKITVPEHEFDPQNLVYSHVKTVINRQALLLRDMGRIDEAKALYGRLAEAEPEEAVRYEAIMETLETGRGLEEEEITVRRAYARALGDYSLATWYQRLIANSMMGVRQRGYDTSRGMLDQLALVIDPTDADMRLFVSDALYEENLFDGALQILKAAPEATAGLKLAEANVYLQQDALDKTDAALTRAMALADEDEAFGVSASALRIYALTDNKDRALALSQTLPDLAPTEADRARAYAMVGGVYAQFGDYDSALIQARAAHAIEDTHERRLSLANALAEAGKIEEGLLILRTEALARPNDPYMLNTLGYYLVEHTDRLDEAFKVLARASALAPTDSYIADSFGWVRFKMGDLDGARRYIELSQREYLPKRNWEIEDHLGDVYWYLGREDDARTAWTHALKEFPPEDHRPIIEDKLENGLAAPAPEKRPLPDVSLSDDGEVDRKDI